VKNEKKKKGRVKERKVERKREREICIGREERLATSI